MKQHDIILIAAEPWENYTWRRRHHVAWALAKNNKVLFAEPPFSVVSPLKDKNISWRQLLNLGRLKYQGRNLYSYSLFKLLPLSLPFSEQLHFDAINKKIIFYNLKQVTKRLNIKDPILLVFFSGKQYDYYGLFNEAITVGDLYDKFTAPSWDGMLQEHIDYLQQLENKIIKSVDIIFTVSQHLYCELKSLHRNVFLVPNGVDYESFEIESTSNSKVLICEKLKRPVIGFLGMMHYIVDFELLNYVAESHPEWTVLLMGKENIHGGDDKLYFNNLMNKNNVVYVGELERLMIPTYLEITDVCLMPMKKIELNRYADQPLKMWEYLAAGKPIVAVDQGCDYGLNEFIKFAKSNEGFVKAIEESLSINNDIELINKRKIFARENSWDQRVEQMMRIIDEFLSKKE